MAYADDVAASESQRQQDHRTASTEAQHVAADANHRQRVLVAQRKWGVRGIGQAIRDRGETPPAGSWLPGD